MQQLLRRYRRSVSRPVFFGLCAALGCLLAGLILGEPLLSLTKGNSTAQTVQLPQAIVLLIDNSGSMDGVKIVEVKAAAKSFVQRQDLKRNQIAVLGFGSQVQVGTPLTSDLNTIEQAIDSLQDGGGTLMNTAVTEAIAQLKTTNLSKSILLFTDGEPGYRGGNTEKLIKETLAAGKDAQSQQITLVAVGTGDANKDFLTQLTGDPNLVFFVNTGDFDKAFQKAETALANRQLVQSGDSKTGQQSLPIITLIVGTWGGFLALGICLALIMAQNYTLHRRPLSPKEALIGVIGGMLAGLVAGAIGQLVFSLFPDIYLLNLIGKVIGWGILGALVGGGISFLVPNLNLPKGLLGGVIGGLVGGSCFLIVGNFLSEIIGRLLGVALIGFFIGLMIALIEQMTRHAWVTVEWTSNEKTTLTIGNDPIILGCSRDAHIYLNKAEGFLPVTAKIYQEGEKYLIEYSSQYGEAKGMKILKHELTDGAKRKFGQIMLETKINTKAPLPAKMG